jgi:hypothetical protein
LASGRLAARSRDQIGGEPRLHHGIFGVDCQNAASPELKGSYYVVNRVLYSYMCDYATSVYEKKNMLH